MIVTAAEMRALEEAAFARGETAESLMEQAGARAALAVRDFFPVPGRCVAVFGKGNNGGDALVAARHLAAAGWETLLVPAFPEPEWSALTRKKHGECGLASHQPAGAVLSAAGWCGDRKGPLVVLDGLLGVGARGALQGELAECARQINELRESEDAQVFALDVPTGLDADSGHATEGCLRADFTLTIGATKRGLVAPGATAHVGRLVVVPLDALSLPPGGHESIATPAVLAPLLRRRPYEVHKGECGRIGIVAGSRGLTGAAILCAAACVKAGAGLVSVYVLEEAYAAAAAAAPWEAMVRPVKSYLEVLEAERDVLALGPGLGTAHAKDLRELLRKAEVPMVLDADALNILSEDLDLLGELQAPALLTPHPGEMKRLDPEAAGLPRAEAVRRFTDRFPNATLLLKGARTLVGEHGKPLSFNTTGSPGMASGGMGDALTGVCAALLGQGLYAYDAGRVGAWLCGRAAELAIHSGEETEESLTASTVVRHLGPAFQKLRRGWV